MSRLTRLIPPTDPAATEDAFAEFAPEPAAPAEVAAKRDWFSEFPEEGGVNATQQAAAQQALSPKKQRPTNWLMLSESLRDEQV